MKLLRAEPLDLYRCAVEPGWTDYNGHMNVAYYVLVFDRGTDALFDALGLGAAYRHATNHTIFVAEAHITYQHEVKAGEPVKVTGQLLAADAKRFHVFHRMLHAESGRQAATFEFLALHVDLAGPRTVPFPPDRRAAVEDLAAAHAALPPPPERGRAIAFRRS